MGCDVLNFRCVLVSELFGSVFLAVLFSALLLFIIASKAKLGFRTTSYLAVILFPLLGLAFGGFSAIYAFATVLVGLWLAFSFNKIIKN